MAKVGKAHRTLGGHIATLRRSKGWSLSELARHAQVGKATLSRWESGEAQPAIPSLDSVLGALGASIEDREEAYSLIHAPRGVRALRATEELHRSEFTEVGIHSLGLGDMIRALRVRASLRNLELAAILGVSSSAVSLWESGERRPDSETLMRLANALRATERERRILMKVAPIIGSNAPAHSYDVLVERLTHLAPRLGEIRLDGLELELILLTADAWKLTKSDPRGIEVLRSTIARRSLLMAERGDVQGAARLAMDAHDVPKQPDSFEAWGYPPAAIFIWAALHGAKRLPTRREFNRGLRSLEHWGDPGIRKELIMQLFGYAAAWSDLEELNRLYRLAIDEHNARWPNEAPVDANMFYAECLIKMGRPHEGLEILPLNVPFDLPKLHLASARATALVAVGDVRGAQSHVDTVRTVTANTGYMGPDEVRVLELVSDP